MDLKILLLSIDLGHMTHRVQYLIRFLDKKNIDTKIFDLSFRHENQSIIRFLKNIFLFPSRASISSNKIIHFPSMPTVGSNNGNSSALMHVVFSLLDFLLFKFISKSLDYNVVVATDPISAFIARAANKKSKTFFVYENLDFFEDLQAGQTRSKFISMLEDAALKQANLVVSVSWSLQKRALLRNSNCIVIPNGADLKYFKKSQELCRDLSLIYAGSIVEWCGLDVAIKGFALLRKKIPGITMKIVGSGTMQIELEDLVRSLSLENSISFTGKLPYNEMAKFLCKSSVGLATFKPGKAAAFASPLKLFDYMAAGLPIVATDIGNIGKILRDSDSGFAIEWDVDEFVQKTETLITNRRIWEDFHKKGLSYVQDYDWDKLFGDWLQEIKCRMEKQSLS